MEVVTDRKLAEGSGGVVSYYTPDVISYSDYYPYGMPMPDRNASNQTYRYGYQNQEKDDEIKGEGNSLNYEYRMHDPRIGRFFAVDPLTAIYAYNSPYAFSENRVIDGIELEGLEFYKMPDGHVVSETTQAANKCNERIIAERTTVSQTNYVHKTEVVKSKYPQGYDHFAYNLDTYGPYVVPFWDVVKKLNKGEEITATDIILECVAILPIGKPLKYSAKITKTVVNKAGVSIAKYTSGISLEIIAKNANLWGGSIINLAKNKTTTVLGRFYGGTEFVKASGKFRQGANTGGINLLNVSDDVYKKTIAEGGDELFFNKYNMPWLDEAIKRGDNIRLVSDPEDVTNLFKNGKNGERTMFGREVEYLKDKGYTFKDGQAVK